MFVRPTQHIQFDQQHCEKRDIVVAFGNVLGGDLMNIFAWYSLRGFFNMPFMIAGYTERC